MATDSGDQVLAMQSGSDNTWLAVWMVTYNHEEFIAQAIESVLNQVTTFPVKLFIGEDFSTDNTRSICRDYQSKYPEKIVLLLHDRNIGAVKNAAAVYREVFGSNAPYVAMLEGDDLWTNPKKLQTQVDFMKTHKSVFLCGHLVDVLDHDSKRKSDVFRSGQFGIRDIIAAGRCCHTASIMLRNLNDCELRTLFFSLFLDKQFFSGDVVLQLAAAHFGDLYVLPETMAIYRIHRAGMTANKSFVVSQQVVKVKILKRFNEVTREKHREEVVSEQIKILEGIIRKDILLVNKVAALRLAYDISILNGFFLTALTPFYILKAALFSLMK
jgi:glycosyltransferase involved in cell wall biosynthesis